MPDQPNFLGLSRNERVVISLKPGEVLFGEGSVGDRMYVVRSGTIRIGSGNTVYEDVEAGGIVGEMAIIEDAPRSATAAALTSLRGRRDRPQAVRLPRPADAAFRPQRHEGALAAAARDERTLSLLRGPET